MHFQNIQCIQEAYLNLQLKCLVIITNNKFLYNSFQQRTVHKAIYNTGNSSVSALIKVLRAKTVPHVLYGWLNAFDCSVGTDTIFVLAKQQPFCGRL